MMTTSNEHNNAPAVPQGWRLVPIEPTRAMWAAVNKLDDEMAAGGYDGKGCSIEQAWNCMLDFAPDAPALAATPAPAPAQEVATLSLAAEDVHAAFAKNFPKSRISQAWINFAADIAQAIAARAAKPAQEPDDGDVTGTYGLLPEHGWDEVPKDLPIKPRMQINVRIDVPPDWANRGDMQTIVEREVKAERWAWFHVESTSTEPAQEVGLTDEWAECKRISELPEVDEALRLFAEGETSEDQAVAIVQTIAQALRAKGGTL